MVARSTQGFAFLVYDPSVQLRVIQFSVGYREALMRVLLTTLVILALANIAHADENRIELQEYLDSLRSQFEGIMGERDGKLPLYVSPIDVEIKVFTEKTAKGGIKTYIFNGEAGLKAVASQSLKFTVSVTKDLSYFEGDGNTDGEETDATGPGLQDYKDAVAGWRAWPGQAGTPVFIDGSWLVAYPAPVLGSGPTDPSIYETAEFKQAIAEAVEEIQKVEAK